MTTNPSAIDIFDTKKVFGGSLMRFRHQSDVTKTTMTCAVFLPPSISDENPVPVIMYLSGLTCTDENVCQKSGVFKSLSEKKIAFIAPDTSPRNAGIPGEDDSYDFGTGAGFYLDATVSPW
eukprot:CAMPEP_0182421972 /NCGR_PEP_ID=MMETSP1167-20130531/7564_1 /TAXON_ID=2988 /ORGANISM="Mallomonas Sp, Strain CCMP3275" /LENGTH=120 /DNA_ID=CAMNT_0024599649 /DNA_START=52 /DNA_END=411 /DNA_ORIENTATION=-